MKKLIVIAALPLLVFCGCSSSKKTDVTPVETAGVTTYIGNGIPALQNGIGTAAELNLPVDMVVDALGNLYVSEQGNNAIRKIAPGGTVTTYAGNGNAGYKDGAAASAEFNVPEGMVIDNGGNLYVADSQNNVIRMITPLGQVSTYAGNGTQGLQNGAAASAEFAVPNGLAIDKARNIYVTDFFNNVIRKISSAGTVSTFAGNGTAGALNGAAASASFHVPSGIAIDGSNNLYIAEAGNNDIRQITPAGQVTTFASLNGPARIAIDGSSNLYVSSSDNMIHKVTNAGQVSTYAGDGTPGFLDGTLLMSEFNTPLGVIANSQGVVLVADYGNNRIRVVTP